MKKLFLIFFLLAPHFASAKRSWSGSYSITATFFLCAEASSGVCAKDTKDGGGSMPYITYRPEAVYQVDHSPEYTTKLVQLMKSRATNSISLTVQGFTIVGGSYNRPDQFVITGM